MNWIIYLGLPRETIESIRRKDYFLILQSIIEREFNVEPGKLFVKCRKRETKDARHLFSAIIYHTTSKSNASIGLMIGGKDHATIIHSRRNVSRWLTLEKEYREKVIRILFDYMSRRYDYMDAAFIKQQVSLTMERIVRNYSHAERLAKRDEASAIKLHESEKQVRKTLAI